jgi:6-phosphogluconolactonase (cycloisomerase 2 family)
VFNRNPDTGAIHRRLCQPLTTNCREYANVAMTYTHASLNAPYGMALSPDGAHLYVLGFLSDNIQALKRNPETGAISHVQTVGLGAAACLNGAYRVVISPDGAYVYTTGTSNKICVFKRNPIDGTLAVLPDVSPANFTFGTDLALSPDASLLFASARDSDSIVAYDRDANTGEIKFRDVITGPTGIPELAGVRGIALHPSGKALYATSNFSHSVASLWLAKPKPMIESVTPASIAAGSGPTQITFNGSDFQPDTFALYGFLNAIPTQFVNSSKVIATLPASALSSPAEVPVYLRTPSPGGGFTTIFTAYVQSAGAIPVPVIESVSLQGALAGAASAEVDVIGSGFTSGAAVLANGVARATQFISSTLLRATLVANDFADIGTLVITVDNTPALARGEAASAVPAGSNKVGLTIAPPNENAPASATSVTPARSYSQIRRSGFTITVKGNFAPGAQAYWNGESRMTRYIDANTVSVSIGAADVATPNSFAAITVANPAPGGGESQSLTFAIDGPEPYFIMLPTLRR